MSVITRQIWVTQHLRIQPIDIVQGSQVGIALQLMDYAIPARASAKAYARGKHTPTTYVSNCTISGSTVSFTPEDGFFIPGLNLLQIEINGAIIPFSIDVHCEPRISEAKDAATPEQVRPLVERAVAAAAAAEAALKDATKSAAAAAGSANAAKASESNAKTSETAAGDSAKTAADEANAAVTPLVERAEKAATDAETALGKVPEAAAGAVQPFAERAENAASSAESDAAVATGAANDAAKTLEAIQNSYQDLGKLQTRLTSGKIEDAELHLGLYLDADGNLRPQNGGVNMDGKPLTGLPAPTEDADAVTKAYVDRLYPVGAIYMSTSDVSPASFIGGTWERLKDRFLLAAGDTYPAGSTGGAATHRLTSDQLPAHRHIVPISEDPSGSYETVGYEITGAGYLGPGKHATAAETGLIGGGQPFSLMPPYTAVYVWTRVA